MLSDGKADLRRLSKTIIITSWLACALACTVSVFSWLELQALRQLGPGSSFNWNDSYLDPDVELMAGVAAVLYGLSFLLAGFLSLRWIYRANANAHRLTDRMSMTPGWNVGWFFVPIAAWWKPFQGVREVWDVSSNPDRPSEVADGQFLSIWWACWLLTTLLGTLSFRIELRATTTSAAEFADALDIASSAALIPATYLFLRLVRDVTKRQSDLLVASPSEA